MSYAIKMGYLIREPCIICGNPESEGHHVDYSKKLEVTWLCKQHHGFLRRIDTDVIDDTGCRLRMGWWEN